MSNKYQWKQYKVFICSCDDCPYKYYKHTNKGRILILHCKKSDKDVGEVYIGMDQKLQIPGWCELENKKDDINDK